MTEQLQFVFDSSDWRFVVPYELQKEYLEIEKIYTKDELAAFCAAENDVLIELTRNAILNKRTELLESFQKLV